ncbi:glycosyltransferase [Hyalangium sp.]|uniref:rhamnosyltransferase WsaF family glycosyltransferase n=1 Tax=Hyalangium sp. TaxID=2028555 RepID=UPI002D3F371D|nr:glycosyltransferase [Hyalangium sp.]HYH95513.1 glycosyltransferase [Hyalangium sp.]
MSPDSPLVTVIIPVKNGSPLLRDCLAAVFQQKTDFPFEVLCVDSGSQDDSLEIIRSFPARLMEIDPATFGHGRTRNLAIEHSPTPFVALLTQDAVPADRAWLRELIAPMRDNERVAGVFGRHVPHPGCIPAEAYMLERHFAHFGADTTLFRIQPGPEGWADYDANRPFYRFFSDNNAALRRSVWTRIPYRDVEFMEDQLWASDILEAGYIKAYAPRSVVRHSHNYSPWVQARRTFDEARYHREYFDLKDMPGIRRLLRERLLQAKQDIQRLMADPQEQGKLSKAAVSAGRNMGQALAWFLGDRHELLPQAVVRRLSLHHQLKGDADARSGHTGLLEDVRGTVKRSLARHGKIDTASELVHKAAHHWKQYRSEGASRTLLTVRRALQGPRKKPGDWWQDDPYRLLSQPPKARAVVPPPSPRKLDPDHLLINWVIPPFSRGGGGHMTIFRTIHFLERLGHRCRVYLTNSEILPPEPMRLQAMVHEWFLPIQAPVRHLGDDEEMEPADIVMATAWHTAYRVRASHCAPVKAYFIQDYEPAFFAVGAEWQLAEDTYHFGFYGLTAGPWLESLMRTKYGMHARSFPLAVDHDVYYPDPVLRGGNRKVFAYMRPNTTRRGFEIVGLALKQVKERFPEVEIHIAGAPIPPSVLPFPFVGHGVLDFDGLRRVFSSSDVAVCLSFTNYSLLPQELAACGCPVVDIDVESTRAAYPEGAVVLAPPTAAGVAQAVSRLLEDETLRQRQIAAGFQYVRSLSWEQSAVQAASALREFALFGTGKAAHPAPLLGVVR